MTAPKHLLIAALCFASLSASAGIFSPGRYLGTKLALETLEERCEKDNNAEACTRLALYYLQGEVPGKYEPIPIKKDHKKAEHLFKRGCSLGHQIACNVVKDLYE